MPATLWSTMVGRFPTIGTLLEEEAPATAALTRQDYGDACCGGRIEVSLRRVLRA